MAEEKEEENGNEGKTFYYCPKCPYRHECNDKNFKKWDCWGWTDEQVRAKVLDHLKNCGLRKDHCSGTDDPWAECEAAVEHELEIKQDIHHEQPEESGKKRRGKASQGVGGSRASDTFAEPRAKSAAVAMMNKPLNRKGCILDQRRRKNNPYPWTDPGNFAHPPFRKLLGFAASFVMGRRQERAEAHGAAFALADAQSKVKARWPRADGSARPAEWHGDMFEMSLALGYLGDARQFRRQHGEVPEGRRSRTAPDVVARAVTTARHTVNLLYNADKAFENVAVVFEEEGA